MAIDPSREKLLTINAAAKRTPKPIHVATCWRWIQRGCRGVRLETILIGGRRYTSCEALERFFQRTTAAASGVSATAASTPSERRQRQLEAVEAELAADGV